ncbi:hypothetical protein SRHO_G00195090 [Serrasalmus rhombeus]
MLVAIATRTGRQTTVDATPVKNRARAGQQDQAQTCSSEQVDRAGKVQTVNMGALGDEDRASAHNNTGSDNQMDGLRDWLTLDRPPRLSVLELRAMQTERRNAT